MSLFRSTLRDKGGSYFIYNTIWLKQPIEMKISKILRMGFYFLPRIMFSERSQKELANRKIYETTNWCRESFRGMLIIQELVKNILPHKTRYSREIYWILLPSVIRLKLINYFCSTIHKVWKHMSLYVSIWFGISHNRLILWNFVLWSRNISTMYSGRSRKILISQIPRAPTNYVFWLLRPKHIKH